MASAPIQPMTNDGRATIERRLDATTVNVDDYYTYFQVDRCIQWVNENAYKKVAIQMPDELLPYSNRLIDALRQKCPDAEFCVMADTTYASCCVDEITAEHWPSTDSIIHVGHACLSPSRRYPVLYVYGQEPFDLEDFKFKFRQELGHDKVLVFHGVEYDYIIEQIKDSLNSPHVVFTTLSDPKQPQDKHCYCARRVPLEKTDLPNYKCLYLGTRQSTLTNLIIGLSQCQFYSYDPSSKAMRRETVNVNRVLMKRFNLIERTKDARIVGIIAGAAGHRDYESMVARMKKILKAAGKKYYTFVVGKLNVPKLANFMEIDVYVLLACHENALLDSKEFYRPIVTPLELELACNPDREWSQAYTTDFTQLLPDGSFHVPMPDKVELTADVSLITGRINTLGTSDVMAEDGDGSGALALQNTAVAVRSAGEYLQSRSWTGLETKLGQTPVTSATEGLRGIARVYQYGDGKEEESSSGSEATSQIENTHQKTIIKTHETETEHKDE